MTIVDTMLGAGILIGYDLALVYYQLRNLTDISKHLGVGKKLDSLIQCFSSYAFESLSKVFSKEVPWAIIADKMDLFCKFMELDNCLKVKRLLFMNTLQKIAWKKGENLASSRGDFELEYHKKELMTLIEMFVEFLDAMPHCPQAGGETESDFVRDFCEVVLNN